MLLLDDVLLLEPPGVAALTAVEFALTAVYFNAESVALRYTVLLEAEAEAELVA